jgi:hydroxylysine kinase
MSNNLSAGKFQFIPPQFKFEDVHAALFSIFGLAGDLKRLEGERDQNFNLTTAGDARFVVKISCAGEESGVVDFQTTALEHLRLTAPMLPVPKIKRSLDGKFTGVITSVAGQEHMMRVLSYVDGVPLSSCVSPSLETARNAGKFQAQVALSLASFSHPDEDYFLVWDMTNGLIGDSALWAFGQPDIRALENQLRPYFSGHVLPAFKQLRSQVIHGDAHTGNLLIAEGVPEEISGLIDFGDMVRAPLVCDAAILALGFAEGASDPMRICAAAAGGFNEVYPLKQGECDLLYDAMLMREALSVLLFDFRIGQSASNSEYVEETRPELMNTVMRLMEIGKSEFNHAFNVACGFTQSGAP